MAEETYQRHQLAFSDVHVLRDRLDVGGEYVYRVRGEEHMWTPDTVAKLQHAVRHEEPEISAASYAEYAEMLNEGETRARTIRGLFHIKTAEEMGRAPVSLDEVEPAKDIVRRFSTGAMSFGSISARKHTRRWRWP